MAKRTVEESSLTMVADAIREGSGTTGDMEFPGEFQERAKSMANAVKFTEQTLTEEQKAQARANIGAAAEEVPREKAEITVTYLKGSVIDKNNQFEASGNMSCLYTNMIPVLTGDRFSYVGYSAGARFPNVIWFDDNENVVGSEFYGDLQTGCRLVTVPAGVSFAKFCAATYYGNETYESLDEISKTRALEVIHVAREDEKREIVIDGRVGGYYTENNEFYAHDSMYAKRTQPIPIVDGDTFYFTGTDGGKSKAIWYNANGAKLSSTNGTGSMLTLTPPSDAVLVRFIAYQYGTNPDNCTLIVSYDTDDKTMEYLKAMNYLYGKKYVACGDSFTAGDFATKTDETWDETTQEYKTYCWHIANRNRMTLINEAKSGSTMYNNGNADAFSVTRYKQIPADADYITLCFGLNDQTSGGTIGELSDTTNATVIGAWNVVLEYLITNMPYAKIGIIIADAYTNSTMRDAIVSVAKYWGIPYLDLKGDPSVPMLIGGRFSDVTVSSKAVSLRNSAFQISDTDSHPNPKGHAYRSTIIENFMRSL